MWRPDKPTRFTEEAQPTAPQAAPTQDAGLHPPAQPGAGASETTIGEKLAQELETISRRERLIREVQDLTLRRVAELQPDQLRRILEFLE